MSNFYLFGMQSKNTIFSICFKKCNTFFKQNIRQLCRGFDCLFKKLKNIYDTVYLSWYIITTAIIIWEFLTASKRAVLQVSGYETLFTKLGSRDQLELLLLYQHLCYIATYLPELLYSISQLATIWLQSAFLGRRVWSESGVHSHHDSHGLSQSIQIPM